MITMTTRPRTLQPSRPRRRWRWRARPKLMTLLTTQQGARLNTLRLHSEDQRVAIAVTAVGLTGAGFLAPPLLLAGGGVLAYSLVDLGLETLSTIIRERRLRSNLLQVLFMVGLTASGYPFLAATSIFGYHAGFAIVRRTQDRALAQLLEANLPSEREVHRVRGVGDQQHVETIDLRQLAQDEIIRVYAGQQIPIDGLIVAGEGNVDQHRLTGESQPIEVSVGDAVLAATTLTAGQLDVRATQTGDDTLAAQLQQLLERTLDYRDIVEARATQLADSTVTPTLGAAGLSALAFGPVTGFNVLIANEMNLMRNVIPLTLLVYLQQISRERIFIKDGRALEQLHHVDTVIFDKTGTLTENLPVLTRIHVLSDVQDKRLLTLAAALEAHQEHPIAQAILRAAQERNITPPDVDHIEVRAGSGLQARIKDQTVLLGSERMMQQAGIPLGEQPKAIQEASRERGTTLIYLAIKNRLVGMFELSAAPRHEAADVVAELKRRGLDVILISGDASIPTQRLAERLSIDTAIAEVLPQDKARLVREWQERGHIVCFVGDGINDAIALKTANVSISMQQATQLATETAQIILMDDNLVGIPFLIDMARRYRRNQGFHIANIAGAFAFSAGGVLLGGFGILWTYMVYLTVVGIGAGLVVYPYFARPYPLLPFITYNPEASQQTPQIEAQTAATTP